MPDQPAPPPYPRDMVGYGASCPDPQWPENARIAVQFVLNYEEGGENNVLHGDAGSETFLSEIIGAERWPGMRHPGMESIYEYGARRGFWRLLKLFRDRELPLTVFAVAMAMQRNPAAVDAMLQANCEIASHGYRWIDYRHIDEQLELEHLQKAIEIHQQLTGEAPRGLYIGRTSPNTHRLTAQQGDFIYSADSYADDLPYWLHSYRKPLLMVPYTLDANDMRFASPQGFNSGEQFFQYLRDSFDVLYEEGVSEPKMLSVGLHCRLGGRPGRAAAVARFIDYVLAKDNVWICRRIDIAQHWMRHHPYLPQQN